MTQLDHSAAHPPHPAADARAVVAAPPRRGALGSLVELTKPGITRLVTVTSAVGFAMAWMVSRGGAGGAGLTGWALTWLALATVVGTALSSAGAGALNEWWERERDARMRRTRGRPIPDGRLTPSQGLAAGLLLSALGVGLLLALVNWAAAAVSLATILSYIVVYTPLKPVTPLATLVGAIPGALPPLIGWAGGWHAGGGQEAWHGLDHAGGWSIVMLMVVWQIPHFLAIAWMYREDYALGGHRVLPVVDESGVRTAWTALLWALTLLPVSLFPVAAMRDRLGWVYVVLALALGSLMLAAAARLASTRSSADARRLFFASIVYLPLVLAAMVADAALA